MSPAKGRWTLPALTAAEVERFHAKVDRAGDCWTWTGETNNQGYGRFRIYRDGGCVRLLAHRVGYALEAGTNPGILVVRHSCDNPPCVRGSHLIVGEQADNIRDAVERNRANFSGLVVGYTKRSEEARLRAATGKRTCSRCHVEKSQQEFPINKRTPDGRDSTCKQCCRNRYGARQMHSRGVPVRDIADRLGISDQAVRQILARAS